MNCPLCDTKIEFSIMRYVKSPIGRIKCPNCSAKLKIKHPWFYWLIMIIASVAMFAIVVSLDDTDNSGGLTVLIVSLSFLLIPLDHYLEKKFGKLVPCK